MSAAGPYVIVAELHVQTPMKTVLYLPMTFECVVLLSGTMCRSVTRGQSVRHRAPGYLGSTDARHWPCRRRCACARQLRSCARPAIARSCRAVTDRHNVPVGDKSRFPGSNAQQRRTSPRPRPRKRVSVVLAATSLPRSRSVRAIAVCVPIASIVTMQPSMSSTCKSCGIAVISFDFSSVATCPSTTPAPAANALTRCSGRLARRAPARLAVDRHDLIPAQHRLPSAARSAGDASAGHCASPQAPRTFPPGPPVIPSLSPP